ncbi:hypothetical protein ACT16_23775 [Mycobacterium heckeshornense]|uniref:Uncharacterized protein n=1 Tax=Mycobacterium heckeshornense TaxID=110505 RepID=A0A2I3EEM8_9MYCO|nr:hypothetical protein ACT16_23775 [Mycobacterium heckeshornense]BCO36349.1 hypothetical protein MHEC_27820 [Mycobacterium heckeshornense]
MNADTSVLASAIMAATFGNAAARVSDPVPLGGDLLGVGVSEDRLDRRSHRRSVLGSHRGVQVIR